MDKGECPGVERHLPDEIKESAQYIESTTWGKQPSPGSHATKQRDYPARAREVGSGTGHGRGN